MLSTSFKSNKFPEGILSEFFLGRNEVRNSLARWRGSENPKSGKFESVKKCGVARFIECENAQFNF